ncbi:alpha/beta hydrolase [Paenibacillus sp. 1011MAR3C5]|uniref:alpha/beta fold hydrolase n=1 Tax=Paenibacillus sp. 1011MAR3C5 TaxID=1675787 RepID=UPI000E6BD7C5|nr:alpha/beta hydrolase [Paenibacillus sp. 1011MAR3C5]RJE87623.1 alpha/beta hydrolase [Paenibacillus sp. 1011MAR3C5]
MPRAAIEHPLFEQLIAFRTTYPKQTILYDGLQWRYHISGKGKPALLLLPGGLGSGEAFFAHFMELSSRYTVIAPYYGKAEDIEVLADGIIAIMAHENIELFHVLGQSFGGLVAQALLSKVPHRIDRIILSHTTTASPDPAAVPSQKRIVRIRNLIRIVKMVPRSMFITVSRNKIQKHFRSMPAEDVPFWQWYFEELIRSQTKQELLAIYQCMLNLDAKPVPSASPVFDQSNMLIIDSPADASFSEEERDAVRSQFPDADFLRFKHAGHLSMITERKLYMKEIRKFLIS